MKINSNSKGCDGLTKSYSNEYVHKREQTIRLKSQNHEEFNIFLWWTAIKVWERSTYLLVFYFQIKLIFKDLFYCLQLYVCGIWVHVNISAHRSWSIGSLGVGATNDSEQPDMGAGNQACTVRYL